MVTFYRKGHLDTTLSGVLRSSQMVFIPCLLILLLFTSTTVCQQEESGEKEEVKQLPRCQHVDPMMKLEEWLNYEQKDCNHTSGKEADLSEEERLFYTFGTKNFAFDSLASDKLGPRRKFDDPRHKLCSSTKFEALLPTSIVIIHHNECLSVLLRMLIGIFDRTPPELIHDVILYEDASEEPHHLTKFLEKAKEINKWDKVKIYRSEERLGLIKAKVMASRKATGDVLVFLDSHCEVSEGWLPPLLDPIHKDPKSVVLPIVDLINPMSFSYSQAMLAKSGFDWNLRFKWIYLPWDYFDDENNNVRPFDTPSMPGGLLAIRRQFFVDLGEYDEGLEIWGGENVELSLKSWMCGGRVLVAPCSRIGHVFRMRRPYKSKPGMDTDLVNNYRVAKAWMGDYLKYYIRARPQAAKLPEPDLTVAEEVKKRLNCKDIDWYIQNVYPDLAPVEKKEEL